MKKLILVILLSTFSKLSSQNISNESIQGIWKVTDVELDKKTFISLDNEKLELVRSFMLNLKFAFSKKGFSKIITKENIPTYFSENIFNTVFYSNIENNTIRIGNRKKSPNILYIQSYKENHSLLFNVTGFLLKVEKIDGSIKLKINKNTIQGTNSLLRNKPFYNEEIKDNEIIDSVDESITTYNCKHLSQEEQVKKCVSQTIMYFFTRKFNADFIADYGLSGRFKNKIHFIITKEGNIANINVESTNPDLSNEIKRTVNLLPKFIPAKHKGNSINSKYSFPFIFQIQD